MLMINKYNQEKEKIINIIKNKKTKDIICNYDLIE